MLGLQNEREWVSFCDKVLQQPELADGPALHRQLQARGRARRRCAQIIVEAFAAADRARRWSSGSNAAQIANARVNTMHDVWAHPQLKARGRWREVGSPAGPLPALLPPGTWDDGPAHGPGAGARRAHRRDPGRARLSTPASIAALRAAEAI